MVEYTYTAYGKSTVLVNNSLSEDEKIIENNIIDNNIFRYKGYCYDTEVELYWLTTRYYSPELCRFISPDSVEYLDQESVNGLNLYCYCLNNPVSYYDPSGHTRNNTLRDLGNIIDGLLNPISKWTALGAIIVSVFNGNWSGLMEDLNKGRLNPFNQDAELASEAKVLSFYKGSTVVRQKNIGTCSAFGTIWLKSGGETTIKHEYGHSIQERMLGLFYWPNIAIPSVIYNKYDEIMDAPSIDYYSMPW